MVDITKDRRTILERWQLSAEELTEIIDANPSLRGFVLGYAAEFKVRKMFLADKQFSNVRKYDDHDRQKKGDIAFEYKDVEIRVEVKSLQTNSIKKKDGLLKATFQCDASDRRTVTLGTGRKVETTCLVVDEFDLLAVNLFAFEGKWIYAFAQNHDLPRTTSKKYEPRDCECLLKSLMPITWPLEKPYTTDPLVVLDDIVKDKKRASKR
jgi:hypothetical protein